MLSSIARNTELYTTENNVQTEHHAVHPPQYSQNSGVKRKAKFSNKVSKYFNSEDSKNKKINKKGIKTTEIKILKSYMKSLIGLTPRKRIKESLLQKKFVNMSLLME